MKTSTVLKKMLKENTGRHFLDSGGAYGRAWEKNQGVDFDKQGYYWIDVCKDDVLVTKNLYHHLLEKLYYDKECTELQREFERFAYKKENADKGWLTCADEFIEAKEYKVEFGENTYNGESILSQVIQYTSFYANDRDDQLFILLQIHGGCDVRGGYTKPRIFKPDLSNDFGYLNATDWCADCACKEHTFDGSYECNGEEANWIYDRTNDRVFCADCLHEVNFGHKAFTGIKFTDLGWIDLYHILTDEPDNVDQVLELCLKALKAEHIEELIEQGFLTDDEAEYFSEQINKIEAMRQFEEETKYMEPLFELA